MPGGTGIAIGAEAYGRYAVLDHGRGEWGRRRVECRRALRRWAAAMAVLTLGALLSFTGPATAAPARQLDPNETVGCCVCRGTRDGEQQSLRSCADGVKMQACVDACHSQGGASVGFGYQQTCSQGCAGFPTQALH